MDCVEKPVNDEIAKKLEVKAAPFQNPSTKALFTYHPPTKDTIPMFQIIRDRALELAQTIEECCPPCPDKHTAIRKVREAVMTANAAIACCEHHEPVATEA